MINDKDFYANAALRQFSIGDLVWVRNYANGPKWISGVVERSAGPVSYEICARGCLISRHVNQIRLRVAGDLPVSNSERMSPPPETPTSDTRHVDMANDRMQETPLTNNTTPLSVHETGIPPAVPGSLVTREWTWILNPLRGYPINRCSDDRLVRGAHSNTWASMIDV